MRITTYTVKVFKVENHGPLIPNPSGLLKQQLCSFAIEEANKELNSASMATAYCSCAFSSFLAQLNCRYIPSRPGMHDNY